MEQLLIEISFLLFSDRVYFDPNSKKVVFPELTLEEIFKEFLKSCGTESFEIIPTNSPSQISFSKQSISDIFFEERKNYEAIFDQFGRGLLIFANRYFYSAFLRERIIPKPLIPKFSSTEIIWLQVHDGKILQKN